VATGGARRAAYAIGLGALGVALEFAQRATGYRSFELMDMAANCAGIGLGAALKARWPDLRVVVLTMHADDQAIMRSLGSGLDGYLLKDSDPEDVLRAIHSAARGTLVLGKGAAGAVVAAAAAAPRTDRLSALDARELEILELLAQGLSPGQIAARLYLAPKTIRNRVSDIIGKLGTTNRDQAITLARAAGLGKRPPMQ